MSDSLVRLDADRRGARARAAMATLQREVQLLMAEAYRPATDVLRERLAEAASYEVEFQERMMRASGITLGLAVPSPTTLRSVVTGQPIDGRLLADLLRPLPGRQRERIMEEVRRSVVDGRTPTQVVAAVMGDKGSVGAGRRGLAMVVQTAATHVFAAAREALYLENDDVVEQVMWVSTLDLRTSDICQGRDKSLYPVGEGPRPPAHRNCRSTTVPVLRDDVEVDFVRASAVGPVPSSTDYGDFIERIKDDPVALGLALKSKQRAKLLRDGGLAFEDLFDRGGEYRTIGELRQAERDAFLRAGIN